MDETQKEHERAVGDGFIKWYNREHNTAFVFVRRAGEAPDLVYRDGEAELGVEVTTCYYDRSDAQVRWKIARQVPNAPSGWSGVNFERSLVANINAALHDKCSNDYGDGCILLVYVTPPLTTASDMEELLPEIQVPRKHKFDAIYLTGPFSERSVGYAQYRVWKLV